MSRQFKQIGIIGTGVMGSGIAQIMAQAGYTTYLYDAQANAAQQAKSKLASTFDLLVAKNKISVQTATAANQKLLVADALSELKNCDLIIEAIVERLDVKQTLIQQLEQIVTPRTLLASNTSSLSITAIAAQAQHPQRIIGYHFFNPVPLMKVVEVIQGLKTSPDYVQHLVELSQSIGHRAVVAKDTPGFIINHAGRAYGTEALKILNENVADIDVIDRILRDGVGFKMGPFELLDLTGLDVSHPVMESIYHQYYQEARYRPSPLTQQMLTAKQLGRKVAHGFYRYEAGQKIHTQQHRAAAVDHSPFPRVWIAADFAADRNLLEAFLTAQQIEIDQAETPSANSLCLLACYGEDTTHAALRWQLDPKQCIAIDLLYDFTRHRTLMPSLITPVALTHVAQAILQSDGTSVSVIAESLGFVAQRVLAMVVNLGCDIAQQQIASVDDINAAVRLGLGYPHGPIEWGDVLGAEKILLILNRISALSHDPRYRPSPWLQRRVALQLPLTFEAPRFANTDSSSSH